MNRIILPLCVLACLALPRATPADDDDRPAAATADKTLPELSPQQQQAVGIELAHPVKAIAARQIQAYGQVLDPGAFIADAGHSESSRATLRATAAETQRLEKLYSGNADVSLKSLQAAQAAQIEAQAQAQSATATFSLQWGPLARLSGAQRQALSDALGAGTTLLLRADLPGRLSLGAAPPAAALDVDGVQVPARVLGILQRNSAELQSVGLLLQVDHAPAGLGPGGRMPVTLLAAPDSGVLVPKGALLYGEQGAYVYRQLAGKGNGGKLQYAVLPVKLLQAAGDAWLVEGPDTGDLIVIHGAGVLWSLQGLGSFSADEEDHD